jgi:hypothetical protein
MKNLSQDRRSPGHDLNPGPPEYDVRGLTTRPPPWVRTSVVTKVSLKTTVCNMEQNDTDEETTCPSVLKTMACISPTYFSRLD